MIVVDTSVWVSTLIERDAHYTENAEWLDYCILRSVSIHFPLLIFPELAGVLARSGMSPVETAGEISKIANRATIRLHPLNLTNSLACGPSGSGNWAEGRGCRLRGVGWLARSFPGHLGPATAGAGSGVLPYDDAC